MGRRQTLLHTSWLNCKHDWGVVLKFTALAFLIGRFSYFRIPKSHAEHSDVLIRLRARFGMVRLTQSLGFGFSSAQVIASARNGNVDVPVYFLKAKQGHTFRKKMDIVYIDK
jgi:hypothetical protein